MTSLEPRPPNAEPEDVLNRLQVKLEAARERREQLQSALERTEAQRAGSERRAAEAEDRLQAERQRREAYEVAIEILERQLANVNRRAEEAERGEPVTLEHRGLLSRVRGRDRPATLAGCAICQTSPPEPSGDDASHGGWRSSGEIGLCPNCQEDGWELPEGAPLPFKRGVG